MGVNWHTEQLKIALGITGEGAAAPTWGSITGTLSDQTDIQNALNGKASSSHDHNSTYSLLGHNHDANYETKNANIQSHILNTENPHGVTKTQVGLGNVDNTSDASKPVSTATQTALDGKSATNHNHDSAYEPKNLNIQTHIASAHAPANAQKNSDITKAEIEAKLTGEITSHTHPGGSEAFPVGSIFMAVVNTNPGTLLGYGTWSAFGAGRMPIGLDASDTSFDTVEETGGAKTHTLTEAEIPSHTHVQNAHTHTQDAHTHTQNAHNHVIRSQTATTGSATSYEHGTLDTSSAEAEATETTDNTTAINQNATATNQNTTATNQNTGGGQAHNNMPPYIVVYMWKRTA